jgi:beta-fructofuranosidase
LKLFRHDTNLKSPRAFLAGFAIFGAAALSCLGGSAGGTVAFDFEGPVFYEPGQLVKDHALVSIDGAFHLFYMTTNQRSFGYATSEDLRHWTIHGRVLAAGPDAWDSQAIWAPSVVSCPYGPAYFLMFYTGVTSVMAQRTCLAMSHVPYLWDKASDALFTPFHGDTLWMKWNENEWSNYRDPGFYRENETCYLAQTAHTRNGLGAIALAQSDDYFTWRDAGPLYVHYNWHALESPFLMKRGGVYHLFFTEEEVGGVSHMSSDSLASGWDILKRSIIDGGHAAEVLDLGSDRYIISRHTSYTSTAGPVSTIRFDTLGWDGDEPRVDMTNLLDGWTVLRGTAFDHQPVFGNNPAYRGDDTTDVGFEGNWWIGTYERFAGPLTGTEPGAVQGDGARGAIRSRAFIVTGYSMRLLVGGGDYPDSCYVALCDAASGLILCRETGRNRDAMDERIWNLSPYRGRAVYITIVDDCGAPFGHINVDGIEERMGAVTPPPPPDAKRPPAKGGGDGRTFAASLSDERLEGPVRGGASLTSSPNPCNPAARIVVRCASGEAITVSIYDVAGRAIRDLTAQTDAHGEAVVDWNGEDRFGTQLPSGVYFALLRDAQSVLARCKIVLAR